MAKNYFLPKMAMMKISASFPPPWYGRLWIRPNQQHN